MDETLRHQRDTSLGQLAALIRRGREIAITRSVDVTRVWQTDCAAAVNQLSGGSKAHWLARAYSDAFMVRSATGGVVVEADARRSGHGHGECNDAGVTGRRSIRRGQLVFVLLGMGRVDAEHVPVERAVGAGRQFDHHLDLVIGEPVDATGGDEFE